MKSAFRKIYRYIVGPEYGFAEEGNEQWYYSLSLVINLMLVWWIKPEAALIFAIIELIHFLTVFIYGYFDLDFGSMAFAYAYFGIHLILLAIAIFTSFKLTVITALITIVAILSAPNSTGNNIFLREPNIHDRHLLLFNTIIFAVFAAIDILLPIKLWIKFVILVIVLAIHPLVDWLEGECVNIIDVTLEAIMIIKKSRDIRKKR